LKKLELKLPPPPNPENLQLNFTKTGGSLQKEKLHNINKTLTQTRLYITKELNPSNIVGEDLVKCTYNVRHIYIVGA
jgi:hypothetical protein